ncbi:hypothetical protein ACI780_11775 [Geodermatophilus sp. SYSU D00814]
MATYAIRTTSGTLVALVKTQDDAPPPAVGGEPGYVLATVDVGDDAVDMSQQQAESETQRLFEDLGASDT